MYHKDCGGRIVSTINLPIQAKIALDGKEGKFYIQRYTFVQQPNLTGEINPDNLICSRCGEQISNLSEIYLECYSCGKQGPIKSFDILSDSSSFYILCNEQMRNCVTKLPSEKVKKCKPASNWFKTLFK